MTDWIDLFVVVLLPLTALFTVIQTRPYFALVSRGIMGVVAVLLYGVLGAPDVALTEALMGTLLIVILYTITVRSTRVLRVGRLAGEVALDADSSVRQFCSRHRLALRTVLYPDEQQLVAALQAGRIDAVYATRDTLSAYVPGLPTGWPDGCFITVLASHGRWHERRMSELIDGREPVMRLDASSAGGDG